MSFLEQADPAVFSAIQKESQRLEDNLELIALSLPDVGIDSLAEPRRAFGHCVEHRLDIGW